MRNVNLELNLTKSDLPYHKELLLNERIRSLWEQILYFKRIPILKRDEIEENHCLIHLSPFGVRNFFTVLATPLRSNLTKGSYYFSKGEEFCTSISKGII